MKVKELQRDLTYSRQDKVFSLIKLIAIKIDISTIHRNITKGRVFIHSVRYKIQNYLAFKEAETMTHSQEKMVRSQPLDDLDVEIIRQ